MGILLAIATEKIVESLLPRMPARLVSFINAGDPSEETAGDCSCEPEEKTETAGDCSSEPEEKTETAGGETEAPGKEAESVGKEDMPSEKQQEIS